MEQIEEIVLNPITRIEYYYAALSGQEVTPPFPFTRKEWFLYDILNDNVARLQPKTREEFYLAKISGADVEIPEPITRIEQYLAQIAGADIETPDPITREEYLLQAWAEGSGGETYGPADIVSFEAARAKKLKSLSISMLPLQDLHGYDSPWAGGAGKNKLPITLTTQTKNGTTFTVNDDGSVTVSGTPSEQTRVSLSNLSITPTEVMAFSVTGSATGIRVFCRKTTDGTTTYPTISPSGNFAVGSDYDSILLEVNTTFDGTAVTFKFQLENGSSPSSWVPYENLCPITGHTGATVYDDPRYGGLVDWNQLFPSPTVMSSGSKAVPSGTTFVAGDKILVAFKGSKIDGSGGTPAAYLYFGKNVGLNAYAQLGESSIYTMVSDIVADGTANDNVNSVWLYVTNFQNLNFDSYNIFNLTNMFGAGNEPSTVEEFEALFPHDYYDYDAGGTLKTTGEVNGEPWWVKSVEFPTLGKNLLNPASFTEFPRTVADVTAVLNADGTISLSGTATSNAYISVIDYKYLSDYGIFEPNVTYKLSGYVSSNVFAIFGVYGSGTDYRASSESGTDMTFTAEQLESLRYRLLISVANGTNTDGMVIKPMVCLSSASNPTVYEPYTNTVYSGTIDLITGDGALDSVKRVLNDASLWTTSSGTVDFRYLYDFSDRKTYPDSYTGLICSYMRVDSMQGDTARWIGATQYRFGIKSQNLTLEQIQADATAGKIEICYELAEPIPFHVDPQEVMSLVGTNNVWADAGQVTVKT